MINLQQSLNDDIRCEIPNHFLDKVQYVCIFDKCTADQRLCCSYCKFRYHNQHIQQLVKISDFTNKVQREGEVLHVKLQEKGQKGQLDSLYWQKIDKKINDEIQYSNLQLQGIFSNIHQEVSANIQQINSQIDERALGQSVFDLQTKVQRIVNRPWSHQSNEAIDLMAKIYRGDKYGELLEDEYFISQKNLSTINGYFTNVHTKLEAFFKSMMEQIPLIFKEGFNMSGQEKQGEVLSIRRKEKDATFPSIRTSTMRREQNGNVEGAPNNPNNYNMQSLKNAQPLISTQRSRSRKDLDNQNNTIDLEKQQQPDQSNPRGYDNSNGKSQYPQRSTSSLGNITNGNPTNKPQSVLFKQHDQNHPNSRNYQNNNPDSLDAFTMQQQQNKNPQGRTNSHQGYYPFNQEDTFGSSEDPYIRYSKQLQQRRGHSHQNSTDRNYNSNNPGTNNNNNNHAHYNNRSGGYQVIQQENNFNRGENEQQDSFLQQSSLPYIYNQNSARDSKVQQQILRKMTIQNRLSRQDFAQMKSNFALFILENNHLIKEGGDKDGKKEKKIKESKRKQKANSPNLDKILSNSMDEVQEESMDYQQIMNERKRTSSLVVISPTRKNQSIMSLQPVPELVHSPKKSKNPHTTISKKEKKKVKPYLHHPVIIQQEGGKKIVKSDTNSSLNNSIIAHSPSQNSIQKTRKYDLNQQYIIDQQIYQGYNNDTGNDYSSNPNNFNDHNSNSSRNNNNSNSNNNIYNNNNPTQQNGNNNNNSNHNYSISYNTMSINEQSVNHTKTTTNGNEKQHNNQNQHYYNQSEQDRYNQNGQNHSNNNLSYNSYSNSQQNNGNGSLSHIPNDAELQSPTRSMNDSPQKKMMSIILPTENNRILLPQGSKTYIPPENEIKSQSHIRQPPQPRNFEDCKLKVQQPQLDFIQKKVETDSKMIKNNQPPKNWISQKNLPTDFPQAKQLKDAQEKWGYIILPDTNEGQSRLGLYKSEKGNNYYDGEWLQGKRSGKGTLYFEDGSIYQGQWKNDEINGKGRLIKKEGDIYEGDFVNGISEGKGCLRSINGTDYIGSWKQNLFEGEGRKSWPNGAYYEGHFSNNQREGQGVFMWKNGSFYQGQFANNQFNGHGIYQWQSGRLYEGEWKEGKMEGKGRDILEQGYVYEGNYKNDKKHGYGVFVFNENKIFKGNWDSDQPHGDGVMIENGIEKNGIWERGQLVKKN